MTAKKKVTKTAKQMLQEVTSKLGEFGSQEALNALEQEGVLQDYKVGEIADNDEFDQKYAMFPVYKLGADFFTLSLEGKPVPVTKQTLEVFVPSE